MNPKIANAVIERDQGRCQYPVSQDPRGDTWRKCGVAHIELHHRRIRGQGGQDSVENLIALCKKHHMHVHAHPVEAREMGLIVGDGDEPTRMMWMDASIPEDGYDLDPSFDGKEEEFPW